MSNCLQDSLKNNKYLEFRSDVVVGRFLIAKTDISPGTVALVESPIASILDTKNITTTCFNCFREKQSLFLCAACRDPRYCSKACQKHDWKIHRFECPIIIKISSIGAEFASSVRMPIRIICLKIKGDKDAWEKFQDLMTHREHISSQEEIDFGQIAMLVKSSLNSLASQTFTLSPKELLDTICRIKVNAHSIVDSENVSLGSGVFPLTSLINHSCDSNATAMFKGKVFHLRVIKPIKKGEEVTMSYIETMETLRYRREELLKRYFFECRCELCLRQEKFDPGEAFVCKRCGNDFMFSIDGKDIVGCNCDWYVAEKNSLKSMCKKNDSLFTELESVEYIDEEKTVQIATKIISSLRLMNCSNTNSLLIKSLRSKLGGLMNSNPQKWRSIVDTGLELLVSIRLVYHLKHPVFGVLASLCCRAFMNLSEEDVHEVNFKKEFFKFHEILKEAYACLVVSHGDDDLITMECASLLRNFDLKATMQ